MKEIITETFKKLGKFFWQSIFFTTASLLILSKTKYPTLFDLVNTTAGLTKFVIITFLLIAFWYLFFATLMYIIQKIDDYVYYNKLNAKSIDNLYNILNNQKVFQNELYILRILVQNKIQEFDLETLQKLTYIEEKNKLNDRKINNIYQNLFIKIMEDAITSLGRLDLIEYKSMYCYKIKDVIFDEVNKWI